MRILLIQPPWYGFQNIVSNRLYLGLAYLGAVLEKNGDEVLILNGEMFFKNISQEIEKIVIDEESYLKNMTTNHYVYNDIVKTAKEFSPEIICISLMTASSSSGYILSNRLKEIFPNTPLVAGGIHPTLLPEEPLKKGGFDIVIRGEGEITIVDLVNVIKERETLENVLGITYLKDGKIVKNSDRPFITDLDSIPFPAFHLVRDFKKQVSSCKGIISSRGCPFACTYCASKLMWTRNVRFRSPQNVVDEIKGRHEKIGISSFAFHDDTFTLNKKYIEEFCNLVLKLDFKITWNCDTRGDTLDLGMLKLMKKAGCRQVFLGLESGSPKIQKLIKKNITTEKVKEAVRLCRKAGIETTIYFMVGFPEETEEDVKESIKAMQEIKADYTIWSILTPYPGTEIWNLALEKNLVSYDTNWANYFHHYNQGNIFGSISRQSWDGLLKQIHKEQNKMNSRLTLIKIKVKAKKLIYLIKLSFNNPGRLLKYIRKKLHI